jgi:hypothetical protein
VIPIRELAWIIHPYRFSRRNILIFSFHCDLSYDGNPEGNVKGRKHLPNTYVFAGFFADETTWDSVECEWIRINSDYGVSRFRAAHLNSKTYEYTGWDDQKKIAYSSDLLEIINKQGAKLYAFSCGIFADVYRRTISKEARRKMGSSYLVCFNSCIAIVARKMDIDTAFPKEDKFSILLDQDSDPERTERIGKGHDGYLAAIESFNKMKTNPFFKYKSRLGTCTGVDMGEIISMQPSDLIAYELFKQLNGWRKNPSSEDREPLKKILKYNVVSERYFGPETLIRMKADIEAVAANPNVDDGGLIIIPKS